MPTPDYTCAKVSAPVNLTVACLSSRVAAAPVTNQLVARTNGRNSRCANLVGRKRVGVHVEASTLSRFSADTVESLGAHVAEETLISVQEVRSHRRLRLAKLLGRVPFGVAHNQLFSSPCSATAKSAAATLLLLGGPEVDGVRVRLSAHAKVDVVAESLGVGVTCIELGAREGRPADLESRRRLVAVAINPEAVRLVVLVGSRVHAAGVPVGAALTAEVTRYGVLIAAALFAPTGGDPGNADSVVVGREERVDSLVLVCDLDLSHVAVADGTRVGSDTDVLAVVVPNATSDVSDGFLATGRAVRGLHIGKITASVVSATIGTVQSYGNLDGRARLGVGLEVVNAKLNNAQQARENTDSFDSSSHCENE